jgi:hypothetical protein
MRSRLCRRRRGRAPRGRAGGCLLDAWPLRVAQARRSVRSSQEAWREVKWKIYLNRFSSKSQFSLVRAARAPVPPSPACCHGGHHCRRGRCVWRRPRSVTQRARTVLPPRSPNSHRSLSRRAVPEDLYPIAILIDELKHDDVQCRLNSMRRLDTIGEGARRVFRFLALALTKLEVTPSIARARTAPPTVSPRPPFRPACSHCPRPGAHAQRAPPLHRR